MKSIFSYQNTGFFGLVLIKPNYRDSESSIYYDFFENKKNGLKSNFIQDNEVYNAKSGTIRAFGYQKNPNTQIKLIRCVTGMIRDIVIDLRRESSTYLMHYEVVLSDENGLQLYIPVGFAHGYETLTDNTIIQYKVNKYYHPDSERTILFCDKDLGIKWHATNPIISEKDCLAKSLSELSPDDLF